jgi:hypothetical protein
MFSNWALAQLAIRSPKSWTFKAGPRLARISRQPFKDSSVDLKIDDRHAELCSVMKQTSKTMDALAGGTRCIEAAVTKCFVTLLVRHIQSWGSCAGPCDCNTYIHASVWPCIASSLLVGAERQCNAAGALPYLSEYVVHYIVKRWRK